jgi:hypothetical protein
MQLKDKKSLSDKTALELNEEPVQALLPEIYEIQTLRIDTSLPILKFINLEDNVYVDSNRINITVRIPDEIKHSDLFLYVNGKKIDMYYQVPPGLYSFKNVRLDRKENLIELFYRIGNRRSISFYSNVIYNARKD